MRRLHLVRHAPVIVEFGTPAEEWMLAPGAEVPVTALAERLSDARLRRIVASPEPKAAGTAGFLAGALGLPVETRSGLEEHHRLADQQSPDRATFAANVRRFFERPSDVVFGTESADQAHSRFRQAVAEVMGEALDDELIVTHGTVMTLLISRAGGEAAMDVWSSLMLPDLVVLDWPSLRPSAANRQIRRPDTAR